MSSTSTPAFLGIDLGTSSVKVVLLDEHGDELSRAEASYEVVHPHPGWAEIPPALWWAAAVTATRQAAQAAPQAVPMGLGLSGQMHGVVPTRADGMPVRPAVLWADSRANAELGCYRNLGPAARRRLANPLCPGMAGPILGWLGRHEPEVAAATRWNLQPKDWLRLRLTGEAHTEPSDASATLLYDVDADGWHGEALVALGLDPATLPPMLSSSGAHAGRLTPGVAELLGLPPGLPVAAGAADTAAAALGAGLVRPGSAQLTLGTGLQVVAPTDGEPPRGVDPVTHYYRAATAAGHYTMAAVLNGGFALGWVCRILGATWAELYATAQEPVADDAPFFLPHLSGERTPYLDPAMRGAWIGLAARHERSDLLRSALEGVAFAAAEARDALLGDQVDPDPLRLAGGGTRSPGWRQVLADVLGAELLVMPVPGASARGAALLGAVASGRLDEAGAIALATPDVRSVVRPRPAAVERHRDRRGRFREHVERLRPSAG